MSTKTRKLVMLALVALLLVASGLFVQPLHYAQVEYDLTNAPVKGVSPGVVLATTALGAFRGIIVDVVWIRMEDLKQDGRFFELVQLADLACRLAPNFPQVWDFSSWNLAYNVSVKVPDFQERWLWVKRGIEVLRDHGIPNNPTEPGLYFNLGMIYLHKVGDQLDEAHFVYKEALGLEMHEILGGSGTREDLERFVRVPTAAEVLLQDPRVREFHGQCVAAGYDPLGEIPDEGILQFFVWVRRPDSLPEAAQKLLAAEDNRYALGQIAAYSRARRLREKCRLDPQKMIELIDEYGPLDWRSPYPHAIYWGTQGMAAAAQYRRNVEERRRKHGLPPPDKEEWDVKYPEFAYHDINHDRVIYAALQYLVARGRLLFDTNGRLLPMMGPDYRFTNKMIEHFEARIEKYKEDHEFTKGVRDAYMNFLLTVAVEFFYRGDEKQSRAYFKRLQDKLGYSRFDVSYEEFIAKELTDYIGHLSPDQSRRLLCALLARHFYYLGCGDDEDATIYYNKALNLRDIWQRTKGKGGDLRRLDWDAAMESVLIDIFAGRSGLPPVAIESLRTMLPSDVIERLEEALEKEGIDIGPLRTPDELREKPPSLHQHEPE